MLDLSTVSNSHSSSGSEVGLPAFSKARSTNIRLAVGLMPLVCSNLFSVSIVYNLDGLRERRSLLFVYKGIQYLWDANVLEHRFLLLMLPVKPNRHQDPGRLPAGIVRLWANSVTFAQCLPMPIGWALSILKNIWYG